MSGTAEGAVRARLLSLLDALRSGENPVHGVHDGALARASVPHISIGAAQGEPWGTKDRPGRAVRVTATLVSGGDRRDETAAARMEAVAATVRDGASDRAWDDGWEVASARIVRTRRVRQGERAWRHEIELLCRCLIVVAAGG